jgi:hypothetical protein
VSFVSCERQGESNRGRDRQGKGAVINKSAGRDRQRSSGRDQQGDRQGESEAVIVRARGGRDRQGEVLIGKAEAVINRDRQGEGDGHRQGEGEINRAR